MHDLVIDVSCRNTDHLGGQFVNGFLDHRSDVAGAWEIDKGDIVVSLLSGAATQPNPMGKVGIFISSRLAEMKRTLIFSCSVSTCHSILTNTPHYLARLNFYLDNHLLLIPCLRWTIKCVPYGIRTSEHPLSMIQLVY
jgi:hypothetical protein